MLNILLNCYEKFQSKQSHTKSDIIISGLLTIVFGIISSQVKVLTMPKYLFLIVTISVLFNFYYCLKKEINLDEGQYELSLENIFFLGLLFAFFYLQNKFLFVLSINFYFYLLIFFNYKQLFSKILILQNFLLIAIFFFHLGLNFINNYQFLIAPLITTFFYLFISNIYKYQHYIFMNHYLLFNCLFILPLYFMLETESKDNLSFGQFVIIIFGIFVGVIVVNLILQMMMNTDKNQLVLFINQISMIFVGIWLKSIIIFILSFASCILVYYINEVKLKEMFINEEQSQQGSEHRSQGSMEIELIGKQTEKKEEK